MNIITYAAAISLAIAGAVVLLTLLIVIADSMVRGHDLLTSRRVTKSIIEIISEQKTARNFYDLGCGRGTLAIRIKKQFPNISVYAIDNNTVRIFFAKIKAFFFRKKIKFLRKNIFDIDLSGADIVYLYLWHDVLPQLEEKLQKELQRDAIVMTNTTSFPTWKPMQKIVTYPKTSKTPNFETLFVYQKRKA